MEQRRKAWWPLAVALAGAMLLIGACSDDADVTEIVVCRGANQCGDSCVNLASDPANCGACGNACASGTVCSQGSCAVACSGGTTTCGDSCADIDVDPNNCGSCGTVCDANLVCSLGKCVTSCGGGSTNCNDVCVDTDFDFDHCGLCNNQCYQGQQCLGGDCLVVCGGGTDECDGDCVNLQADRNNCGACDVVCGPDDVCSQGVCARACVGNTSDCSGNCVDIDIDPNHCGGCDIPCGNGEVCSQGMCTLQCGGGTTECSDLCVDTMIDPANCGMCGMDCGGNSICDLGTCMVVSSCLGAVECSGACVDLDIDSNNCGSCGNACGASGYCSNGNCTSGASTCDIFAETFADNAAGWTLGMEWGIGPATAGPSGSCQGVGDPGFDHTPGDDNGIAGVNIGGLATTNVHGYYYLTSPVVDTSAAADVYLEYWRWLSSDYTNFMQNIVEVYDGAVWNTVYLTGGSPGVNDFSWTQNIYDVTAFKNPTMQVRIGFQVGSSGVYDCPSWNLDDFKLFTTTCP